jgi:3-deoxy-7-phosphoheptulonate synthase
VEVYIVSTATERKQAIRDVNVSVTEPLLPPSELLAELPIAGEAEEAVLEGRRSIRRVLDGEDGRFIVIAGPCSIHDYDAALEYAGKLASLAQPLSDRILTVMRVYFEKPRTTVGWKGLVYDPHLNDSFDIAYGLRQGRSLLREVARMGLHTATEFLDPIVPQYFADLVSWAAIGARTAESQTHRQMASGLSMPVGFKNGTDGDAQIAVDAMLSAQSEHAFLGIDHFGQTCIVHTNGNPYGHLVLRGGKSGPNFGSESIAAAQELLSKADVPSRLLVDCSHGNSNKDHTRQNIALNSIIEQRIAGNDDIIGCMLESNLNAGSQSLSGTLAELEYGVSVTDACIGWEETEELLREAYDKLADVVQEPVA